ncbi:MULTISPECIES: PEPxxWA-CTERM sorting domain-containing protein [Sphingomonas]|uniref:PEPxxWA-CTERM sorting domain-containing protein n=1 Tax=Sphingomonas TaxID=13687 RepID=UPI00092A94A8|nr:MULTISPECIES: PEPxxWA-CTERM sorting domain-containing protein [Sphingomonas]MCW6530158.1 PEPxxWA-CTERM sorting domain-containing protein [Sphingomonas lycopersici]OJU18908.1 MAG: hypothetical protein BGN95_01480 [Sphingomonas sp. 66-10]
MAFSITASSSAMAATFITGTTTINGVTLNFSPSPVNLTDKIKGNGATSANNLPLITDSGYLVDFSSPDKLKQSGGAGFASVSGIGNGANSAGFSSLTIDPRGSSAGYTGFDGFTAINFGLDALGKGNNTYYGDIVLNLLAGGSITFQNVAIQTNGNQHFGISSDDNRIFSSIEFENLWSYGKKNSVVSQKFDSLKQVSIDLSNASVTPGVPEPATWTMMIIGFGAVGGVMRKRKVKTSVAYS